MRISFRTRAIVAALLAVSAIVCASLILARLLGHAFSLGPLSQHMFDHIALLGFAAPASAWMLRGNLPLVSGRMLTVAATVQIVLIWIWHLPPVFMAAQAHTLAHAAMTGTLFAAGLLFWCAILGLAAKARWQAILGLLITGKLFCLFAAVLVFSPRLLYDLSAGHGHHAHHGAATAFSGLADQQLAGLIMIAVCPLTYVAAGIAVSARWLAALELSYPDRASTSALKSPLIVSLLAMLLAAGNPDVQSALAPASVESKMATSLSWLLFIGGGAIFILVMAFVWIAMRGGARVRNHLAGERAIMIGGVAFPAVVLSALLAYGLWLASAGAAHSEKPQEISVQGERWWWRVTYEGPDAAGISSANEIRVAVGRPVRLSLTSPDVIHSFWTPALAGKVDLIPGRINTLEFTPSKAGTYRGQCAEYCGGPHAMMALRVVVMEPEAYADWLAAERRPAAQPDGDATLARGQELFMTTCVACHAVRGTRAAGRLGPDLTHVASRGAIGGEVLPMSEANLARWLVENERLKPNNLMPEYQHLAPDEITALSAYIASLK